MVFYIERQVHNEEESTMKLANKNDLNAWKRTFLRFANNPFSFIGRAFVKTVIERAKYVEKGGYNAAKYWQDRLTKHRFSIRGVGDQGLSKKKNEKEYLDAADLFKNLCRHEGIIFEDAKVLDIGCGNGFYAGLLAGLGVKEYTGIDITEVLFDDLRERFSGFQFIRKDVTAQEIAGCFDLIIMIDVTQHIISDLGFSYAMQNIKNHMSENGVFILTSYLSKNTRLNPFYVKNRLVSAFEKEFPNYIFSEAQPFRDKYFFLLGRQE
jgi:SAM-dependent methyltransferase